MWEIDKEDGQDLLALRKADARGAPELPQEPEVDVPSLPQNPFPKN